MDGMLAEQASFRLARRERVRACTGLATFDKVQDAPFRTNREIIPCVATATMLARRIRVRTCAGRAEQMLDRMSNHLRDNYVNETFTASRSAGSVISSNAAGWKPALPAIMLAGNTSRWLL